MLPTGEVALHLAGSSAMDSDPHRPSESGTDRTSKGNRRAILKQGNVNPGAGSDTFQFKGMAMSERVRRTLKQFDVNDDEQLDVGEVTALVEHMVAEERQNTQLKWAVIFLTAFTCLLLAGMFGLTWAVVAALKDTKTNADGVMRAKASNVVVQVASYDTTVGANGLALPRANATAVVGNNTFQNPLRSAAYTGVRLSYSPLLSTETLMEMNYLVIAINGSEVLLKVQGVARILDLSSPWGSVVKVVTPLGTLSLYDTNDTRLDDKASAALTDMGIALAPAAAGTGGRRLLQQRAGGKASSMDGLFNTVGEDAVMDPTLGDLDAEAAADDKASAKTKEGKARAVLDKADRGDSSAEAVLAANFAAWRAKMDNDGTFGRGKGDGQRYASFKKTFREITDVNSGDAEWFAGLTSMSDLDMEELASAHSYEQNAASVLAYENDPAVLARDRDGRKFADSGRKLLQTTTYTNWVELRRVSPVRNQGGCGGCWAFAATQAVESAYLIANAVQNLDPRSMRLSMGQAVWCCNRNAAALNNACSQSSGCGGGAPANLLDYAYQFGLADEASTWNVDQTIWAAGADQACNPMFPNNAVQSGQLFAKLNKPYTSWGTYGESFVMSALRNGPVVVMFTVTSSFRTYLSGTYNGVCGTGVNHAMLAVGYDIRTTNKFMIIKNSWGIGWGTTAVSGGERGYARVIMTGTSAGKCGMYMFVYGVRNEFSAGFPGSNVVG